MNEIENTSKPIESLQSVQQEANKVQTKHLHKIVGILGWIIVIPLSIAAIWMYQSLDTPEVEGTPAQPQVQLVEKNTTLSAYVAYLSGTAWQFENGRRVEIIEGDSLEVNAEVMTDENTRMVLMFDDGSVIRLDEETLIKLEEISPQQIRIYEQNGQIFSHVQKDENHKFLVRTSGVTIESLGTAFSVENTDGINVRVFESSVKIKETFGTETEVAEKEMWNSETDTKKVIEEETVLEDEFLAWSLKETGLNDEKDINPAEEKTKPVADPEKETEKEAPAVSTGKLNLIGKTVDDGIFLSWTTSGIDVSKGFKIVKSTGANPAFPSNGYVYVSDSSVRNYKLGLKDGKTWNIRVCQYLGSTCGEYSNNIEVKAPYVEEKVEKTSDSNVNSIKLVGKKSGDSAKLEWKTDGDSSKGFKVVWAKNSGPTYPTRDGDKFHYLNDSDAKSDTVNDLDDGKKYYFRVCEYLGGKCGTYSNEISIDM